jgi:hypothetical protein
MRKEQLIEDINKIKIIHEIKKIGVDDTIVNKFIEQIDCSDFKDNLDKFFRDYMIEDNFLILFWYF